VSEEVIEGDIRADDAQISSTARTVRRLCTIAYCTVWVVLVVRDGIPTGRALISILIVAGLGITCIGRGWHRFGRVFLDWLPFTLVLIVYDVSRTLAKAVNLPLHENDIARTESWLFGGTNPSVWLQQHYYHPGAVRWYDGVATLIYMTHFFATPVVAAVLWVRNRVLWLGFIVRVVALSFAGLATYVLFPEAPPWYAARDHYLPAVARTSTRGLEWMHLGNVRQLVTDAQNDGSNPIAAMPSLHTAAAMLIALFLAARIASRWRYLLYLYPAAMGLVLVYTGEHYVLDLIVGVGYAIGVHRLVLRWERSRGMAREAIPVAVFAEP
jgi:membrane-associated phospholipid phosphatase